MWEKLAWAAGGLVAGAAAVLGAEYLASSGPTRDRSKEARRRKQRRAVKTAEEAVKMLESAALEGLQRKAQRDARDFKKFEKKLRTFKNIDRKAAVEVKAQKLAAALKASGAQVTVTP